MLSGVVSGIYGIVSGNPGVGKTIVIVILAFVLPIFVIWMVHGTHYILEEDQLKIKFFPFKKTIPYEKMRSVKKTTNPLSSPAPSLKRIEITYGRYDFALISPKDRDLFIKELKQRCPHLDVEG